MAASFVAIGVAGDFPVAFDPGASIRLIVIDGVEFDPVLRGGRGVDYDRLLHNDGGFLFAYNRSGDERNCHRDVPAASDMTANGEIGTPRCDVEAPRMFGRSVRRGRRRAVNRRAFWRGTMVAVWLCKGTGGHG